MKFLKAIQEKLQEMEDSLRINQEEMKTNQEKWTPTKMNLYFLISYIQEC